LILTEPQGCARPAPARPATARSEGRAHVLGSEFQKGRSRLDLVGHGQGGSSGESRRDPPGSPRLRRCPGKTPGTKQKGRQRLSKLGSGKILPGMGSGSRARFLRHGEALASRGRRGGRFTAPAALLTISLRPVIPRQVARQQSPLPLRRLHAIFKL
jgi:hypothetical protein